MFHGVFAGSKPVITVKNYSLTLFCSCCALFWLCFLRSAIVFPNPTPAHISGAIGVYVNTPRPHAAALFIDFMKSAEGAKILASTGRISGRKGVKSLYDDLNNLEERGIPLLVVGPEQSELVAKPMERIMKDILVP